MNFKGLFATVKNNSLFLRTGFEPPSTQRRQAKGLKTIRNCFKKAHVFSFPAFVKHSGTIFFKMAVRVT